VGQVASPPLNAFAGRAIGASAQCEKKPLQREARRQQIIVREQAKKTATLSASQWPVGPARKLGCMRVMSDIQQQRRELATPTAGSAAACDGFMSTRASASTIWASVSVRPSSQNACTAVARLSLGKEWAQGPSRLRPHTMHRHDKASARLRCRHCQSIMIFAEQQPCLLTLAQAMKRRGRIGLRCIPA